ncbi:uncharacterized protein LOC144616123 isoform X1 [Panthera onca]
MYSNSPSPHQGVITSQWKVKKKMTKKETCTSTGYLELIKPWFMLLWRPSLSSRQSLESPKVNLLCVAYILLESLRVAVWGKAASGFNLHSFLPRGKQDLFYGRRP